MSGLFRMILTGFLILMILLGGVVAIVLFLVIYFSILGAIGRSIDGNDGAQGVVMLGWGFLLLVFGSLVVGFLVTMANRFLGRN